MKINYDKTFQHFVQEIEAPNYFYTNCETQPSFSGRNAMDNFEGTTIP